MNREAFKLARDTLRTAVREYGWRKFATEHASPDGVYRRYHAPLGRFEGEHWSIAHYVDLALNGGGDEPLYNGDNVAADLLAVEGVERAAFGFEPDTQFVALWYADTGFIRMQQLTATEYDELREAWAVDFPGEES